MLLSLPETETKRALSVCEVGSPRCISFTKWHEVQWNAFTQPVEGPFKSSLILNLIVCSNKLILAAWGPTKTK